MINLSKEDTKLVMDLVIDRVREIGNDMKHAFAGDKVYLEEEMNKYLGIWESIFLQQRGEK